MSRKQSGEELHYQTKLYACNIKEKEEFMDHQQLTILPLQELKKIMSSTAQMHKILKWINELIWITFII